MKSEYQFVHFSSTRNKEVMGFFVIAKIPKCRTSRKISAFSYKEMDSLLLEDFLKNAEKSMN